MRFSQETLQKIRDRLDIVEVIGAYTKLTPRGDRWWGLSPFKSEKTPSFTVKPDQGFYYCFATNRGGDIFKFIGEMEGLSFPEAVEYLAERAGVELQGDSGPSKEDRDRKALYELYERVSGSFHYLLTEDTRGKVALDYALERGLSRELIDEFNLGYAPSQGRWLHRFLRSKSYSGDFLSSSGLFSRRAGEYALFRHRLMFPIWDDRKRVAAFGGRALSSEERAKYINSPETAIYNKRRTLYGITQAVSSFRETRRAYIAEGYLDVIAMHQGGFPNTVAPLGTAFTEEQAKLLRRWVDEVVLVFDADNAGVNASFKAAIVAEGAGLGCHALALPPGSDPADLLRTGGGALTRAVENTRPVLDFLLDAAARSVDRDVPHSGELLLRKLFPYINIINSEVRRETALEHMSETLRVSSRAVRSDFERWRRGEQPQRVERDTGSKPGQSLSRESILMLAVSQDSELFAYLRKKLTSDELSDPGARRLFLLMEDAFRHEEPLPRGMVDRLTDETLRNLILEKLTSGEYVGWSNDDIDNALALIHIRSLEGEQRRLESELKHIGDDDPRGLRTLLEEKMSVDQELAKLKVRADD